MRLVTKGWIAVPAMMDLAMRDGRPIKRSEIRARHRISKPYIDQLFGKLRRSGLVKSVRGRGGGYWLARDIGEVSVADIVMAVDGGRQRRPAKGRYPASLGLWSELNEQLFDYLRTVTLKQLVEKHRAARK